MESQYSYVGRATIPSQSSDQTDSEEANNGKSLNTNFVTSSLKSSPTVVV